MPISVVSIVDSERIWFKSHPNVEVNEISRGPGLCASAILQDDIWEINDARTDPRTLAHPLVIGDFGLRFYATAPLKTSDGYNLGTMCIIDRKPRQFTKDEYETLKDLAAIVINELELCLMARKVVKLEREARIQAEEEKNQAEKIARTDILTGLGNRRAFDIDLQRELDKSRETTETTAIAMIDLNGLKKVNDFRGHDMGDSLLRQFGSALSSKLRRQDKAYRFGGDEFAIIASGVSKYNLPFLKERVEEATRQLQKQGFPEASASVGIATLEEVEMIPYKAVQLADLRMYSEKAYYYRTKQS